LQWDHHFGNKLRAIEEVEGSNVPVWEKLWKLDIPAKINFFLDGGLSMGLFLSLVYWKIVILVNSVDAQYVTKLVKIIGISYSHAREQKKFGIILVWTRRLKVQTDRVRSGYNN
jgi:hypothetical protein